MFSDVSTTIFLWEFIGTAILILMGNGVCALVNLKKSKGYGDGWLTIAMGWGLAVFVGATVAERTGAHLNPAVTLGTALNGKTEWKYVPVYIVAQLLGAMFGAVLCWLTYKKEFDTTDKPEDTLGIFATVPQNRSYLWNTVTETIATFVLVFFLLSSGENNAGLGYAAVAFVIISIGASLGGPTGYAVNPARDLGPRIVYSLLPIKGKGSSQWSYAFVPIVGPLLGACIAALAYHLLDKASSTPINVAMQLILK